MQKDWKAVLLADIGRQHLVETEQMFYFFRRKTRVILCLNQTVLALKAIATSFEKADRRSTAGQTVLTTERQVVSFYVREADRIDIEK